MSNCFNESVDYVVSKYPMFFDELDGKIMKVKFGSDTFKYDEEVAKELCMSITACKARITAILRKFRNHPEVGCSLFYGGSIEAMYEKLKYNKKYYLENYERIRAEMKPEEIEQLIKDDIIEEDKTKGLIDIYDFPVRVYNILRRNDIETTVDLISHTKEEIKALKNLKEVDYNLLIKKLESYPNKCKELSDWLEK